MDVMTHRAALCVPRLPLLTFTFHFLFYPNREHRQVILGVQSDLKMRQKNHSAFPASPPTVQRFLGGRSKAVIRVRNLRATDFPALV